VNDIALDSSGRILIVGSGSLLERYTSTGSPDTSFDSGGTGQVTVQYDVANGEATALALQSDGKVVVAGNSPVGLRSDFGVARFLGDTATALAAIQPLTARVADAFFADLRAVSLLLSSDGTAKKHKALRTADR
jgi:hypothetical protein